MLTMLQNIIMWLGWLFLSNFFNWEVRLRPTDVASPFEDDNQGRSRAVEGLMTPPPCWALASAKATAQEYAILSNWRTRLQTLLSFYFFRTSLRSCTLTFCLVLFVMSNLTTTAESFSAVRASPASLTNPSHFHSRSPPLLTSLPLSFLPISTPAVRPN